ncbi:CHASE2 domain-containing protein [Oceanicella sp. SM1341]|uniref:CHASE2 domain-containing protein n=1 Tax=Oceanicella sp. SM1341 TaxID=1548889 RepID=UPI000E50BA98|nr:adenylate/guanylate cyclase domain-containing protein [Oceanicella sp. SM1341]
MRRGPRAPRILALVGAVLAVAWVAVLARPHLEGWRGPLDWPEAMLTDLRLLVAGPKPPPQDVVIVAIDDATLAGDGGTYPLPRARLSEIVNRIAEEGARALAVDVLLVEPTYPATDAVLAEALGRVPTVLAAAGRFRPEAAGPDGLPVIEEALRPLPRFGAVAASGLVNIVTDASGTPRHVPLLYRGPAGIEASFVLQAAALWSGAPAEIGTGEIGLGGSRRAVDLGYHLALRAPGPAGTIRTVSARHLLETPPGRARLAGRLVVVGYTATAVGDRFSTPFDPVTPGVEVLAAGMATLLSGEGMVRSAAIRRADVAIAAVLALGGVVTVALLPLVYGLPLVAGALALWLGAVTLAYAQGQWFSAALPAAACLPPVLLVAAARHLMERRAARASGRAARALSQFQPPLLAARIAADPGFLTEPLAITASVLFVDLSGFTRMSELMGPEVTREFLKSFHGCISGVVDRRQGLVLSYMGDGAMAVFGLPEPGPDDAANALAAAFALVPAVRKLSLPGLPGVALDLRVGVHRGPVVVSRLGHETHQHVTVTGDSVNLASRLMEVAKAEGAAIAVSADLVSGAGPQALSGLPVPDTRRVVAIRGRMAEVAVSLWRCPRGAEPALDAAPSAAGRG